MTGKAKRWAISLLLSVLFLLSVISILHVNLRQKYIKTASFSKNRQAEAKAFLDQIQSEFPIPGIAMAMVYHDSLYYATTGIKNENKEPLTTSTSLFAGNISEPMLATAILKLADEGEIDLDEPVVSYLPYFKMGSKNYSQVTVRHLLTHTSGIQKYDMIWDTPNLKPNAPEVTTRSIASQQPKFSEPGSKISRSAYNYDVLADIINKVTGFPFEEYLKQQIFSPAGMASSSFYKPVTAQAMPFRISNWLNYNFMQDTIYPYNRTNSGSHGLHTSAKDMASWMHIILNEGKAGKTTVLDNAVVKDLTSVQLTTSNNAGIGFGFDIMKQSGLTYLVKGSNANGFNSQIVLIPERKIGVAVLSNISGYVNIAAISKQLALWLEGKELSKPKIPVSIALGKKLETTGSVDSALALYNTLRQSSPANYDCSVESLSELGVNLLYKMGEKEKAIKVFQHCTRLFPSSAYAHMYLAEAYILNKDLSNCKKAFAKAKSLPKNSGFNPYQASYIEENILVQEEKKRG